MKTLKIHLRMASIDEAFRADEPKSKRSIPLPYKVLGNQGQLLAEGVADSAKAASVKLSNAADAQHVFVRVVFPGGKAVVKQIDMKAPGKAEVDISDESLPGDSWAKWAVTRSALNHASPEPLAKLGNVWLRLWGNSNEEGWQPVADLPSSNTRTNEFAKQVDLDAAFPKQSRLLQFGGAKLPATFVSLPPTRCRLYFTTNPDPDSTSLPVKVVLTSFRPEAETLLEFLARDALRAADSVSKFDKVATELLHDKVQDPIGAVIGAYFLLRMGRWKETNLRWFDNLYDWFPWSSDAALIRCAVTARSGISGPEQFEVFFTQLQEALVRGYPLFEEGHRVLKEMLFVLQGALNSRQRFADSNNPVYQMVLDWCWDLASARVRIGSSFAFTGTLPGTPSSQRHKGPPVRIEQKKAISVAAAPVKRANPKFANAHQGADAFSASSMRRSSAASAGDTVVAKRARGMRALGLTYLKDL
ncbi:hypothetical protein OU995_01960 [Roseateles sp. SL47]|uniref:hypothetical protein n=1 Tax=Roseateles sp. SL47 TaxID=2995138 RepID=UPI00226D4D80|nr:hypothetical protein [Roseateles sp. SL47]WAC73539.1 hypothetical protein OU995_01960 [Roseateles sp. SL47]